jgi:hypothetical protein
MGTTLRFRIATKLISVLLPCTARVEEEKSLKVIVSWAKAAVIEAVESKDAS